MPKCLCHFMVLDSISGIEFIKYITTLTHNANIENVLEDFGEDLSIDLIVQSLMESDHDWNNEQNMCV